MDGFLYFSPVLVVGLDHEQYIVSEGDGAVEVCTSVKFPETECPLNRSFSLWLSTAASTAGPV